MERAVKSSRWGMAILLAAAAMTSCGATSTHVITLSEIETATATSSSYRFTAMLGGPGGASVSAVGVVDAVSGASDITLSMGQGLVQEYRTVGGERYATLPYAASGPNAGKPTWTVVGAAGVIKALEPPAGSAANQFLLDVFNLVSGQVAVTPSNVLADLKATRSQLAAAGPGQVGGTSTRRYTTTLSTPPATIALTIDVDAQGRLRQLIFKNSYTGSSGTIDISDFGMSISLSAPPGARPLTLPVTTTSVPVSS
jgi:hypothetical protein